MKKALLAVIYKKKIEFNNKRIFECLLQICNRREESKQFKEKIIHFLNNQIPNWQEEQRNFFDDDYNYQDIPSLVEKICGYSKEGLDFLFKKYNFIDFTEFYEKTNKSSNPYYDYIKKFVNNDFKN